MRGSLKHKHAKRDGESIKEWLDRVSHKDSPWFKKAKRRKKYRIYYDIVFWIKLKFIRWQRGRK